MCLFFPCSSEAWDTKSSKPLHRESGFFRIKPGTKEVAYICAQNIGLVDLEEGEVDGTSVTFGTKFLCRMSFANEPETTEIKRTFCLKDDVLEQIVFMATKTTPILTKHLHVKYRKASATSWGGWTSDLPCKCMWWNGAGVIFFLPLVWFPVVVFCPLETIRKKLGLIIAWKVY